MEGGGNCVPMYSKNVLIQNGQCTVSAHSAGAYTATLLVMVIVVKGSGRAPPTLTSQANFTLMMECTPESGRYHSMYSVVLITRFLYRMYALNTLSIIQPSVLKKRDEYLSEGSYLSLLASSKLSLSSTE
jgi:hypothetical protein